MSLSSPAYARGKRHLTLPEAILKAGAWPGLECVIDPKSPGCYQGGQTLFDQSGKGMDFWSGSGSGVDAGDLTMIGEPGRRAMGNFFTKPTSSGFVTAKATTTFTSSMHKAGARWTFLQISDYNFNIAGNSFFSGFPGIQFSIAFPPNGLLGLHFYAYRSNASAALSVDSVGVLNNNAFPGTNRAYFVCTTMDDVSGVFQYHMNDVIDTHFGNYVTPDAANPGGPFQVGASGNNNNPIWGSFEDSCTFALWSRPLPPREIQRIRQLLMPVYRFGL